jgi:hypothetical protein
MPTIKITASIAGGDKRHGVEVLVGDTVQPQKDNYSVDVEVPWDAQAIIRPRAINAPSPEQEADAKAEAKAQADAAKKEASK